MHVYIIVDSEFNPYNFLSELWPQSQISIACQVISKHFCRQPDMLHHVHGRVQEYPERRPKDFELQKCTNFSRGSSFFVLKSKGGGRPLIHVSGTKEIDATVIS